MARMIPPYIPRGYRSIPEIHLFYMLRDAEGTDSWTVLHSLDIARHRSRVSGEIDFLVIVPGQGVLCIEVKGRTRRDERGLWYYGSDPEPDPTGPFKQVRESMYSLLSWLRGQDRSADTIPFTYAVFFPISIFQASSPEWEDWQVVDARKIASRPVSILISEIISQGTERIGRLPPPPDNSCWERLVRTLRPAFETPVLRNAPALDEELLDILEKLDESARVLFLGAAGTGKTRLLGLEAERLRSVCDVLHLGFFPEVGGITVPAGADFNVEHVVEKGIGDMPPGTAGALLVDDLHLFPNIQSLMEVANIMLTGGIHGGRWRMATDFFYFSRKKGGDLSLPERVVSGVHRFTLRKNRRHRPTLGRWLEEVAGVEKGTFYREYLRPDHPDAVRTGSYEKIKDLEKLLGELPDSVPVFIPGEYSQILPPSERVFTTPPQTELREAVAVLPGHLPRERMRELLYRVGGKTADRLHVIVHQGVLRDYLSLQ